MSRTKPFAAAAAHDALAIDTEDMQTDELLGPDGSPLVVNSEDLFEAPTPAPAEPRAEVPPAKEEDTQIDAVPEAEDAVMVDEEGIIGELPPPSAQDIDLSVDDIVARAGRTDDYLRKWRTTSVDRKEDWDAEEAYRLQVKAQQRGYFYVGAAGGVVVVLLGFAAVLASGAIEGPSAAPQMAKAPALPDASVKAPVVAPPVVEEPVAVDVVEEPVVAAVVVEESAEAPKTDVVEAAAPVAQPSEPTQARVVKTGSADGAPTLLAEASTWTEGRFRWAGALVAEEGVELAWYDAAGREVLDRVACAGRDGKGYRCLSGRSPKRIAWALEQGATPGTWTVKACRDSVCEVLGTTDVP